MRRYLTLAILIFLLLIPASARLGGGGSYSSGRSSSTSSSSSRSSSSSSYHSSSSSSSRSYSSGSGSSSRGSYSGSGGGLTFASVLISFGVLLFLLVINIGLPIAAAMFLGKFFKLPKGRDIVRTLQRQALSQILEVQSPEIAASKDLLAVEAADANFSEPVFKEFANLLFSRFQCSRGQAQGSLAGYVDHRILNALLLDGPATVSNVIIGATTFKPESSRKGVPLGWQALDIEFEACFADSQEGDIYTIETWTFARQPGILSQDPKSLMKLGCPNCGHHGELSAQGICPFCDQVVNNGAFNWKVVRRQVIERIPKPPITLSLGGVEAGTELPTRFQPNLQAERRAFETRYPDFSLDLFIKRASQIFHRLQEAWSSLDFDKARPYETDPLYDTHRFWIERYKQQGLVNHLEQVKILKIEACRFDHDAFYDMITLRIFASMIDYTKDNHNTIVGGDNLEPRTFSEYWTFIRRTGAKTEQHSYDLSCCPSCGADLNINQTGICEYCQAKVTSGDFDWVLSSIDQDESYTG